MSTFFLPALASLPLRSARISGDGSGSSAPPTRNSGHDRLGARSITGVGRDGVVSASGAALVMNPPQQSTAASTLSLEQANSSVWRPPEQKPMQPTLPLAPSRA